MATAIADPVPAPARAGGGTAGIDPIRAAAIRALYAQMHNTAIAAVIITVYMMAVSWPFTPWPRIVIWAGIHCLNMIAREGLIRAYNRRNPPDGELERWARFYVVHQTVTGLIWGATIFLFAHLDQPITIALTLCCLYSIAAGAVPAQSYTPASLHAVVGTIFALVLVRFVATGQFVFIMVGVTSALFGVTMIGFCRVQARTLNEGFRIRFENAELVDALTVQTAEAEDARHQAEVASLAKSQFLAAASHDLRQPLYALSLFSSSLDELSLDAESRRVVGSIQDSIGVMETLFEGLLDVSKLEAGVVRATVAPVPVDALFDRLSQVFRPIALERGLDLRFRSDDLWVASDALLLEQVLANLVTNALRATTRGGVLVAARTRGDVVSLEVWDTGIGIAAIDRERIFEEFVQLGNPERDRRKGLGLGLSIARRAAALIGGEIGIASRPGVGSRFSLTQPLAPASPAASSSGSAATRSLPVVERTAGLPLLVVDDDRDVRAALGDLLARWGMDFDLAADGDEALAAIEAGKRYGLVLSDYRLTGSIDGLTLVAAIAAAHPAPAPAAVLITGDFDPAILAAAHERGVPVLHKPLRAAELRAILGLDAAG